VSTSPHLEVNNYLLPYPEKLLKGGEDFTTLDLGGEEFYLFAKLHHASFTPFVIFVAGVLVHVALMFYSFLLTSCLVVGVYFCGLRCD